MSPDARELFDAGRAGVDPSSEVRARVRATLIERLGPAAAMATVSIGASASAGAGAGGGTALLKVVSLCALGGALLGGGYTAVHRLSTREIVVTPGEPAAVARPQAVAVSPMSPVSPQPAQGPMAVEAPPLAAAPATPSRPRLPTTTAQSHAGPPPGARDDTAASPADRQANAPRSSSSGSGVGAVAPVDGLQAELGLVRAAHDALRAGQPAVALERTEEHRREYPDGALSEERDALRVCAICALGRSDAETEAQAFLASHPSSPFVTRIREACPR
jgi:hypothetical protein